MHPKKINGGKKLKLYGLVSFGHWIDLFLVNSMRARGAMAVLNRKTLKGTSRMKQANQ